MKTRVSKKSLCDLNKEIVRSRIFDGKGRRMGPTKQHAMMRRELQVRGGKFEVMDVELAAVALKLVWGRQGQVSVVNLT